jgi:hemolysin III
MENLAWSKKYLITNEVLNAVTHGIGFLMSIAGLVLLLLKATSMNGVAVASYLVYGIAMMVLFLSSTLYHSLIFTKARKVFQVFDHASIFLLIAGSYTPICLLAIPGWKGIALLAVIWVAAILGIIYKAITLHKMKSVPLISTILYNVMGWACVLAMPIMWHTLGIGGVILLILGGLTYSLGSVFYSMKDKKFTHVIWHLFVMGGAAFMFFAVYLFS